jgi:hypothetical protein
MSEAETVMNNLPPGTERIEDTGGTKILLAPQPSADPNQPLVSDLPV